MNKPLDIRSALAHVVEGKSLSTDAMQAVMRQIMSGNADEAQIGAFLVALRMKGETLDEITGAAKVMRELASPVTLAQDHLVDTCGTGGDGANLFNVSTAATFVAAAAGVRVAKHGNRSVSSSTGSADVLESAGVALSLSPEQVARCVDELGVGFLFAPAHHGAMKHAIGPRRSLGLRTIFNLLGPLTNPAGVKRQVIGVFDASLCKALATVLGRLGSEHVLVIHADDGLDEISLSADTLAAEWRNGEVHELRIQPEDFGYTRQSMGDLSVESAEESLQLIQAALSKTTDARAQKAAAIIALNAGAAIYVSGIASSLKEGVSMAEDAIGSGLAKEKIQELVSMTQLMQSAG